MQILEAWADCAAMLMDLPESISSSPDFAQELGVLLCDNAGIYHSESSSNRCLKWKQP